MRWSGSPSTTVSRARPCADGLAENDLKPWRKDMWCIPQVDGEYVARMEDVLDLYAEAPDPKRPVVCFDESPTQLIGEVRQPIPARAGPAASATTTSIAATAPSTSSSSSTPTAPGARSRSPSGAPPTTSPNACANSSMSTYPDAERIRVVLDNLSTHSAGALYQAFPPAEARRILRRLEFHYTPKHASWLNMVEIEIGVLRSQCLDRRIDDARAPRVAKSPPGNDSATPPAPASNGCSQPTTPAPKWPAPIPQLASVREAQAKECIITVQRY